jgi:hypothetical protein
MSGSFVRYYIELGTSTNKTNTSTKLSSMFVKNNNEANMLEKLMFVVLSMSLLCSTTATARTFAQENSAEQADYLGGNNGVDNSGFSLNLNLPQLDVEPDDQSNYLHLAAAQSEQSMNDSAQDESIEPKPKFSERWFTANKFHQYLGWGAVTAAVVAGLLPKPEGDDSEHGAHHTVAIASAFLGGAAVGTGLLFHYKDLSLKKGFSNPDNLHALLATLGAIGLAMAVSEAPNSRHASYGIGGAVLMLGGIKVTW